MRLAFVLLGEARLPERTEVLGAYRRIAPGGPTIVGNVSEQHDDAVDSYRVGTGEDVHVALVKAAVPDNEAEDAARYSISSFGTGWTLPAHSAHLIVAMQEQDSGSAPASMRRFTRVLAAIAEASSAVGVYWGAARATHAPRFFIDLAERDEDQLMLWTGVSVAAERDDRLSLLTLGMAQLGHKDVLLTAPRRSGNDALRFLFDLLGYFVARGGPVPDGDTVGRSGSEKLVVRWVASPIDGTTQVVRVDMPDGGPGGAAD